MASLSLAPTPPTQAPRAKSQVPRAESVDPGATAADSPQSPVSQLFHESCLQVKLQTLAGPASMDALFRYTAVSLMEERATFSETMDSVLNQLPNPAAKLDALRECSEDLYKRDKMMVEFQNTLLRAEELVGQQRKSKKTRRSGRQTLRLAKQKPR